MKFEFFLKAKGKKKITIEVHRAAGIYEYENTLKAVRKAIEMGMERVETDVTLFFFQDKRVNLCLNEGLAH